MREIQWDGGVAGVDRAVGDLFDKVRQLEVHLFFVLQGQRVALAAQLYGEEGVNCVAFNFQAKRQCFALWCRPQSVIERLAQIDLGVEQLQRAVVEFELAHAACPPPFGSNGAGAVRVFSLGLWGINTHPRYCARRRISMMRDGLAAAGWTCRVAVVCMVLPRSVVEELGKYQPSVDLCQLLVVKLVERSSWRRFHDGPRLVDSLACYDPPVDD
ncbi:hypothetical protein D3C84_563740 [compost metagenome]